MLQKKGKKSTKYALLFISSKWSEEIEDNFLFQWMSTLVTMFAKLIYFCSPDVQVCRGSVFPGEGSGDIDT